MKPLGDKSSFESINMSSGRQLRLVNPSTANDWSIGWARDDSPSTIANEGIIFVFHGLNPMGVFGGRMVVQWFGKKIRCRGVAAR